MVRLFGLVGRMLVVWLVVLVLVFLVCTFVMVLWRWHVCGRRRCCDSLIGERRLFQVV
jgi:hypothetical protein